VQPVATGRIPIRLEPLRGEAFDAWLDSYAQRLQISTVELGKALGIPAGTLRAPHVKLARAYDAIGPEHVAARACGLDAAQVRSLWSPLVRYERLLEPRATRKVFVSATRPLTWSRFCPSCLHDTGGRWLAAWRLPWYTVCPHHQIMLSSDCSQCGRAQRATNARVDRVHGVTTLCSRRFADVVGRGDRRCAHDLTTITGNVSAPADLLAFQAEVAPLLDPDVSDTQAERLADRLIDALTVAVHVGLDPRALQGERLGASELLAAPLAEAHALLSHPDAPRMVTAATADMSTRPTALPRSWRSASPELSRVVLAHRDAKMCPTDRLRYRTVTGAPRCPEGIDVPGRTRRMPCALWPDWSIRLHLPGLGFTPFRTAAAALLCVPGATATLREISALLPHALTLDRAAQQIADDERGPAIFKALCVLAEAVDHDSPIDYDRRRALAMDVELLDARTWNAICRDSRSATIAAFRLRAARLWLWETITGGVAEHAGSPVSLDSADELIRYRAFAIGLRGEKRRLIAHARGLLDANGCEDEPLTWSPHCPEIARDALPGGDPDAVDAKRATDMLDDGLAPRTIARRLGVTIEQVRYAVREHPHEDPPYAGIIRELTAEQLRADLDDVRTMAALAERYDVARITVRRALIAHRIPIPPHGRRPTYDIDAEWLREEYLGQRRSIENIAREVGAAPATISRLLTAHAIPIRGRGSPRRVIAPGTYPEPLASAVERNGGSERVRRFQIYARTRSLSAAAKHMGVHQHALTAQLAMLEECCSGQLLERLARDQRPQRLTRLGRRLLDQADQHLGPHPDAPPRLPEPLAALLASHRGDEALDRFLATVGHPTLKDAAISVGVHPASLSRTMHKIDATIGGRVFTFARVSDPLRLTVTGRLLLRHGRDHRALSSRKA